MNPNLLPTELEIQEQAARMFPNNPEMRSSFVLGVYHTVYYNLKVKNNEAQEIKIC